MKTNTLSSRPRSILSSALWNLSSMAWSMAALFFLTPFLVRHIGENGYGFYILLTTVSGFLGLMNLGLGEATLRYVAYYHSRNDEEGINRVVGSTLFVYLLMGITASTGLYHAADYLVGFLDPADISRSLATELFRITCAAFCVRFVSGPFFAIPQAVLRYDITSRLLIAENVVRVAGSFYVVNKGFGIHGLIFLNLFLAVFFLIITFIAAGRVMPGIRLMPFPERKGLKEIFNYGIFSFLSQMVGIAWQYTDRMLLGILVGTGAVAYFSVPQELVLRFLGIGASAGAVLMPKFSSIRDKERLCFLYLNSTAILMTVTFVIFTPLAVLFRDFIRLWVSPEFAAQSGFIGTILAASCVVRGAFIPYQELFRGIGKPQYHLVITILSSATILIADLILIPAHGLAGAGYAFCLSPVWGIACIFFVYRRIFHMKSLESLIRLVFIPMITGFGCMGFSFWLRTLLSDEIGWKMLIFMAGNITAITAGVLVTCNLVLGSVDNPLKILFSETKVKFRKMVS